MKYLKQIGISLIVLVPTTLAILIYNDKITENSPVYYKQGVEFYNNGDYQNAYYNFGKIKFISPLYTTAIYKQAKSAQRAGDFNSAILKYKLFLEKNPNSIFAQNAEYNLASCYYYLKDYENAKNYFLKVKNNKNNEITSADYFLGIIEKNNDKEKAANYLKDYIEASTGNRNYEIPAAEELSSIGRELTADEKKLIGITYYKNKKYQEALKYFSTLPLNTCWDYLVLANHYAGNKVIAKKLIENDITAYSAQTEKANLKQIYDIYTSYMPGSKIKNWSLMSLLIKKHKLAGEDYVLYKLADILPKEKAINLYNEIVTNFPSSEYAPEALWELFWNKYINRNYSLAQDLAVKHLKTYNNVKSTKKMMFWYAKTLIKLNKTQEANTVLSKLNTKYPDDYYGLRADFLLNKKTDFWQTNPNLKLPLQKEEFEFPISFSQLNIKDLKLINTLFSMGDYELWLDADYNNKIVKSWFEAKKDRKSASIVLARDEINSMDVKPPLISAAYKLAYPLYYADEINIAAQKLNIDAFLITGLIREESYFNEHAKSSSNAIGLMQLMPSTANYMSSKLSMSIQSLADLENPKVNLYIGCNYLKYLKDKFNNDLYVVAAYNGGEGALQKWITKFNTDDLDEFIENIPYDETKHYVKKVFKSYHMYRKIYQ